MEVEIKCEITEYACMTHPKYQSVSFCSNNKSVVISFLNDKEKVLIQTEVSIKDFLETAKIINLCLKD